MIWLLYAPLNFIIMIIGYILNPIICLFCNEEGELPEIFSLFQTWDDSCNPRFFIMEGHIPNWLKYDYDKHYEEYWDTTPALAEVGRNRCFARVIDGNFTIKERIQRYICRVLWLTRNCAYGFAFWGFGRKVDGKNMVYIRDEEKLRFSYDKSRNILTRPWSYQDERHLFGNVYLNIYIGWKISKDDTVRQCMIASRPFALHFEK